MSIFSSDREGGMFDGLKARLGFGNDADDRRRDDDYDRYDDDFDDGYDDFGNYDDEFAEYGRDYDDAPSDRVGGFRPATTRSKRSSRNRDFPHLVSIDDVKANTQIPDRLNRDPLDPDDRDYARPSRMGSRSLFDDTSSAPARDRQRAEGLDSLFEPTVPEASADGTGYDPYEAYSSATPMTHSPNRAITVLKPVAYGDVERVAKAVKSGDVVVLVLRNTPDDLSKRILDFSFGVASALDASVECPGEKVFAIARGRALDDAEKARLRNQGAL